MDKFPDHLNVNCKEEFYSHRMVRIQRKMRKLIYDLMLKGNELDFFDLDLFNREYVNDMKLTTLLINEICDELEKLGWKTFLGYGGTGLYIYSSEELPPNVY